MNAPRKRDESQLLLDIEFATKTGAHVVLTGVDIRVFDKLRQIRSNDNSGKRFLWGEYTGVSVSDIESWKIVNKYERSSDNGNGSSQKGAFLDIEFTTRSNHKILAKGVSITVFDALRLRERFDNRFIWGDQSGVGVEDIVAWAIHGQYD